MKIVFPGLIYLDDIIPGSTKIILEFGLDAHNMHKYIDGSTVEEKQKNLHELMEFLRATREKKQILKLIIEVIE